MKKRVISILLVICMGMTLLPTTVLAASQEATKDNVANLAGTGPTTTFKDVSKSDWFYSSVQYALEHNIFNGTGKDTFSPSGTMTRGMYVTVLGHIAGIDPSQYAGNGGFVDVDKDAYYTPYVAWAVENKIIAGVGNNRFDPDGIVTREQMAVFTVRYFEVQDINYGGSTDVTTTPGDLNRVSGWAQEAVLKLWKTGLLQGDNNGNFNPKSNTTRAEAATFSVRTNEKAETWRMEKTGITPTPPPRTVSFNSNGGTDVASVTVANGGKLSDLPAPQKTNAVFMGWYADSGFQGNKFSEEDTINSDMTLYAKYMDIEAVPEKEEDESYSLADQVSGLTFSVVASDSSSTADNVKTGITLEVLDGSKPVSLVANGSNGVFSVAADGGFTEGATYKLTLNNDGLSFAGKKATIRTCSFNIKKKESFDIEFNEGMIYIPSSDLSNIIKNNQAVSSLSVPLLEMTESGSGHKGPNTGSFTYKGGKALKASDVLCVYSGAKPKAGDDAPYLNEDIAYIKVTDVNGTTIRFSDADSKEVLFMPDVLPIYAGMNNKLTDYIPKTTSGSFSISKSDLDFSKFSAMGLNADTKIDKGDYVALYSCADLALAKESDFIYGRVTAVTSKVDTVNVAYTRVTVSEMQKSNDYYSKNDIKGDTMLEDTDTEALLKKIKKQVQASNFANRAAVYMTSIAKSTEGFKKLAAASGSKELSLDLTPQGSTIEMEDPIIPAAAAQISEIKNLKVTPSISNKTKKLKDGVRCSVEVSFSVSVDIDDDNAVNINLSATFVEEVKMSMTSSAEDEWDYLWGFIPYLSEYNVNANIDVYDYTGVSFNATITSGDGKNIVDISKEIQSILSSTDSKKITASVRDLFETYSNMMKNEADWITIFETTISEDSESLFYGIIMIDTTIKFVASAEINVALGCSFEYQCGTRYCFWAKLISMDAGSSTVDLADETYTFKLYVMGSLGLKAGINLEFAVGLFATDLDSIGLTAEAGVYTKLYGYFYYELKSVNGVKKSNKSGSIYLELGAYLKITFKAQVISGTFEYNPTLFDEEWPLWTAGDRYVVYDFAYKDTNTKTIKLKDKDRIYALPDGAFDMTYLDLQEGGSTKKSYPIGDFDITFSNKNFVQIGKNIVVKVPDDDTHIMKCDVTVTWKDAPLAFSSVPIARTFKLQWDEIDENGYTIYFDSNGGSEVGSITKQYGATVTAPDAPTKIGYTFNGWYSDKQLTKLYTSTKMGWGNIILYAKWKPNTNTAYKVKHYQQNMADDNYTLYETENLTGITDVNVTPAVKSYTGFTAPSTQSVTITADGSKVVNYYYTRNSYTLTFNANGGTGGTSYKVKYGTSISAPAVTRTGYTLNSWNPAVAVTMPAADTTYTAQWQVNTYTGQSQVNTYTVQFDSNSGSSCNNIIVAYNSAYGALPVSTRTGYTFDGWYTSETDNNGAGTRIMSATIASITSVQILYAKWTANTNTAYTVKHYQQNVADDNYTLYETENLTGTTDVNVTPAVKNYTGFTAPSTQSVTITADGSGVVNYYYTRNSYTLTFEANGGTGGTSDSVKYGASITAPIVTRAEYSFNGWNTAVEATMLAANTTYTAQWTEITNTVGTLNQLIAALADDRFTEVTVTQAIQLTNGTSITGQGKTVHASVTGFDGSYNMQDGSTYNIFTIASGSTVSIQNLTIKGGSISAIDNAGTLTMNGVTITQSGGMTASGAGLNNTGKVVLRDCVITKNVAEYGAGFLNSGVNAIMTMEDCSIIENSSVIQGGGGGENNDNAKLYLNNCTFSNNMSSEIGGAINNYNATVYILNSTIAGNLVWADLNDVCGGGIGNNGGTIYAVNSLLTNNFEKHQTLEMTYDAKPSDIGVNSNGTGIYLYNTYCGAYVTTVTNYLAVTGAPANSTNSTVNPAGNGLTGIFGSYVQWSFLDCPALVQQANGTYTAPLAGDSAAMSGGCDVYFDYTASGVTIVAYDIAPIYLIGTSGGTKVTDYQGGGARAPGVIGAFGN